MSRCYERGVCYNVNGKFFCYCDDGHIGGNCDPSNAETPDVPASDSLEIVTWVVVGRIYSHSDEIVYGFYRPY